MVCLELSAYQLLILLFQSRIFQEVPLNSPTQIVLLNISLGMEMVNNELLEEMQDNFGLGWSKMQLVLGDPDLTELVMSPSKTRVCLYLLTRNPKSLIVLVQDSLKKFDSRFSLIELRTLQLLVILSLLFIWACQHDISNSSLVHSWISYKLYHKEYEIKHRKERNYTKNGKADLSWTYNSHNSELINWEGCQVLQIQQNYSWRLL